MFKKFTLLLTLCMVTLVAAAGFHPERLTSAKLNRQALEQSIKAMEKQTASPSSSGKITAPLTKSAVINGQEWEMMVELTEPVSTILSSDWIFGNALRISKITLRTTDVDANTGNPSFNYVYYCCWPTHTMVNALNALLYDEETWNNASWNVDNTPLTIDEMIAYSSTVKPAFHRDAQPGTVSAVYTYSDGSLGWFCYNGYGLGKDYYDEQKQYYELDYSSFVEFLEYDAQSKNVKASYGGGLRNSEYYISGSTFSGEYSGVIDELSDSYRSNVLNYTYFPETLTCEVTGGKNLEGHIEIPSTVEHDGNIYTVTSIGKAAFGWNYYNITSVTIPNTVSKIGSMAFYACFSLSDVKIGNSVTEIEDSAFAFCEKLSTVELPNSLKIIGNEAFKCCYGLTDVVIPPNVTNIGNFAFAFTNLYSVYIPASVSTINDFYGCDNLAEINVAPDNAHYTSEDGVLFNKDKTVLMVYPRNNTRTEYYVSAEVCKIEEGFNSCKYLTSINVAEGNSVYHSIDGVLFNKDDTALLYYPIANPRNSYEVPDGVKIIDAVAFWYSKNLISIKLPNSLRSINYAAFAGCSNLKSCIIPESVETIGDNAFENCLSLESIQIPSSVSSIGNYAFMCFEEGEMLKEVKYLTDNPITAGDDECAIFSDKAYNNAVLRVASGGKAKAMVTEPWKNFRNIVEDGDFRVDGRPVLMENYNGLWCGYCPRATVAANHLIEKYGDDVIVMNFYKENGNSAKPITKVDPEVPADVVGFPTTNFDRKYKEVYTFAPYGDDVVRYDDGTLALDKYYENIERPKYYDFFVNAHYTEDGTINAKADFNWLGQDIPNCNGVVFQYYLLGDGISVRQNNFYRGDNTYADFPGMDYYINGSQNITEILNNVVLASWLDGTDAEFDSPESYLTDGYSLTGAKVVAVLVNNNTGEVLHSAVCEIGEAPVVPEPQTELTYEFYDDTNTCKVTGGNNISGKLVIPSTVSHNGTDYTVTMIDDVAFYNTGITSLELPETLISIGGFAFKECYSLESVVIPGNVNEIGTSAFEYCTALTSVQLPTSLLHVGGYAFYSCYRLTSIEIPAGVRFIGEYAFNCQGLRDVKYLSIQPIIADATVFGDDTYQYGTLTVLREAKGAARLYEPWKNFVNIVSEGEDPVPPVGYSLSLKERKAFAGTEMYIPVTLKRDADILGMELTATLTPGAEFVTDADGFCDVLVADTYAKTHTCSTNITASGALRMMLVSSKNDHIAAGEDVLLRIPVRVADDAMNVSDYITLTLNEAIISDANSKAVRLEGETSVMMPVAEVIMGDLDGDGETTVADVTNTVEIVLGNMVDDEIVTEAADVTGDGEVNLMDIVTLINSILSKDAPSHNRTLAEEGTPESPVFEVADIKALNGETVKLELMLRGANGFIGAQYDVVLPEGWSFAFNDEEEVRAELCAETAPHHTLSTSMQDDSTMRMIIYSLQNRSFAATDCCLANVYVTCNAGEGTESTGRIDNAIVAAKDLSELRPEGVEFKLTVPTGVDAIGLDKDTPMEVYSTDGYMVATSVDRLAPGLYIVRQGDKAFKVLVK